MNSLDVVKRSDCRAGKRNLLFVFKLPSIFCHGSVFYRLYPPSKRDGLVFGITNTIKTAFKSLCEDAGIDGFRFHYCRHTATIRMIMAGCSHTEVMKITGHSQLTTFLRYLNIKAETTNKIATALDRCLSEKQDTVDLISDELN